MKLIELECKDCGGNLKVEEGTDIVTCPYCGASYRLNEENMEKSGYEFEKGRIKAQREHMEASVAARQIPAKFMIIPIVAVSIVLMLMIIISIATKKDRGGTGVSVSDFNRYYDNGRQYGTLVEDDLSHIIESNKKYENKKITFKYEDKETSDPEEIAEIKKSLNLSIYYEVTLDYDKQGYINVYTLEKAPKTPEELEHEANRFNMHYHAGTTRGSLVSFELESLIESNRTNKERKITVKYNGTETTDIEEISKIKDELETFTEYKVILEYDSDGFINVYEIQ